MKRSVYDLMYRFWAPWDAVGVRPDLIDLLASGRLDAKAYPRTLDLGCGTGANVVHLAGQGFDATGVDFSQVALAKARTRAAGAGVDCTFIEANLTADLSGLGTFDFLTDFGSIDDLQGADRTAAAANATMLARPGAMFLMFCFYGALEDLPRINFSGPSRAYPGLVPGEVEALFGESWDIEEWSSHPDRFVATFLLTRRG